MESCIAGTSVTGVATGKLDSCTKVTSGARGMERSMGQLKFGRYFTLGNGISRQTIQSVNNTKELRRDIRGENPVVETKVSCRNVFENKS